MLSILIPTYNYNCFSLVEELHKQCLECNISFEILCYDDDSKLFHAENNQINSLENCKFEILTKNIGRSAIRNLLAKKAMHENLLFLDADTVPLNKTLISNYLKHITKEEIVIYGGIQYQKKQPTKPLLLRWTYGNSREALSVEKRNKNVYLSLLTLNFFIKKAIFEKVKFNENIPNLRHEDTLFSYDLKKEKIKIIHIDNPVIHLGLDTFDVAIEKEKQSIIALKNLTENNLIAPDYVSIYRLYSKLKKVKVDVLMSFLFKKTEKLLLKNLSSNSPSLFIFDLYRLGYLSSLG